jgi:type VI protein secretion system component VasF
MTPNPPTDSQMEALLLALTDAILTDRPDVDALAGRYNVSPVEVAGFIRVIRRLHQHLTGAQPSERFVKRLHHDLMGTPQNGLVSRVRYLPPRVQIAAGVVAVAGFMLLARRRLLGDAAPDTARESAEVTT